MELLSILAASRGTTEISLANEYTVRQLAHMGKAHVKNQTFVLNLVGRAFGGKSKGNGVPGLGSKKVDQGGMYEWFKNKPGYKSQYHVVDLETASPQQIVGAALFQKMPGR